MMNHRAGVPFWLVAVAALFVLVKGATWLTGSAPSTSSGAPIPQPVEYDAPVARRVVAPVDPIVGAALSYDATLDLDASIPTPFGQVVMAQPWVDRGAEARERFELSTIFVSERVRRATINGLLLRVGDTLDEHWTVTGIAPAAVVICHTDGTSVTLTVRP